MRRREFVSLVGGAAAWPLAVVAQQGGPVKRVGILAGSDDERIRAFREGMQKLGWIEGRNLRIDLRFASGDPDRIRTYAAELVTLVPDVIVTTSRAATTAAQELTKTIPIIFTAGTDPATQGTLQNIARPEGNTTGFTGTVDSIGGKWLELLKEAAPHITRVALVFNPQTGNVGLFPAIEAAAPLLGVEVIKARVRDPLETVRAIDAFAVESNGGLLVVPVLANDSYQILHRLAAQHRLPSIHFIRSRVADGGLMSYATDTLDIYRRAPAYVDRLLRGTKVGELPVQFPTKFELVVNLKTAKAIGLNIPDSFLLLLMFKHCPRLSSLQESQVPVVADFFPRARRQIRDPHPISPSRSITLRQ
jgi:putative ABC transport system substrate-binding protein